MMFRAICFLCAAVCICLLIAMPIQAQTTWHVDADAPNDPGPGDPSVSDPLEDGSADHPYDAIQEGIDAASASDIVLVSDGTYTGDGNRDLDFNGKAITVQSEIGPENCIIDCQGSDVENHRGFYFHMAENQSSVVQGFTIQNGYDDSGAGIYCYNSSSPTIINNIIRWNATWNGPGGGIHADLSSPIIIDNIIAENTSISYGAGIYIFTSTNQRNVMIDGNEITANSSNNSGGGIQIHRGDPTITNNTISGNTAGYRGGGINFHGVDWVTLDNNIIVGNSSTSEGAAMFIQFCTAAMTNNSIINNSAGNRGGGFYCDFTTLTITDTIFWGNSGIGSDSMAIFSSSTVNISYSDVEDGQGSNYVQSGSVLNWGPGMIDSDPLFVTGPRGDYYLSQVASGQASDSPCVHNGSDLAENICVDTLDVPTCMNQMTTRTDHVYDGGQVDIGYHYSPPNTPPTAVADLSCLPSSGTLPFALQMTATLTNNYTEQLRRVAAKINVVLGNGGSIDSFRSGYTNVMPGESFVTTWSQSLPELETLVGGNTFELVAEDVTPAPYNLPPYAPAGDVATASCLVTGISKSIHATLSCTPSTGTLPFTNRLCIGLENSVDGIRREYYTLDWTFGNGTLLENYRSGWNKLAPYESSYWCWNEYLFAGPNFVGTNEFSLFVQDLTEAPYNQPPYPPEGETDTASCIVTGFAP